MYYPNYLDFEHENELRAWSLSCGRIPQYPIFANVEQYFLYYIIIIAHTFLIFFISDPLLALTKGQLISKWKYEVVALPIAYERKNLKNSAQSVQGRNFQIFRSYFGQQEDSIFSFWNFLTFNYTTPTTYYLFVQISALQFYSLFYHVVFLIKSLSNLRSKSL